MVTLRQLVSMQEFNDKNDIEIIFDYFRENECEAEGIELIAKLSKAKLEDSEMKLRKIKSNMSVTSSYYYKDYCYEMAGRLDRLTRAMQLGYSLEESFYKDDVDFVLEEFPKYKKPNIIWRDLYEFLREKGVKFKGETE